MRQKHFTTERCSCAQGWPWSWRVAYFWRWGNPFMSTYESLFFLFVILSKLGIQTVFQLSWCPDIGSQCITVSCFSLALSWLIWPWNLCLSGQDLALCKGWDCDQTRLSLPVLPTVSFSTQTETWRKVEVVPGAECCMLALSNMELASFCCSVISSGGWLVDGRGEETPWGHEAGGGSLSGTC